MKQRHLHMARRKMCHVMDELYTLLLRSGGEAVDLCIRREAEGLRLLAEGDFAAEHRHEIEKLAELLQPAVRNPALVEEFWEDRSAEERVFGRLAGSPEEYPEKTFLQRRMKEYLRSGKRVPAALGMFCLPLEETP